MNENNGNFACMNLGKSEMKTDTKETEKIETNAFDEVFKPIEESRDEKMRYLYLLLRIIRSRYSRQKIDLSKYDLHRLKKEMVVIEQVTRWEKQYNVKVRNSDEAVFFSAGKFFANRGILLEVDGKKYVFDVASKSDYKGIVRSSCAYYMAQTALGEKLCGVALLKVDKNSFKFDMLSDEQISRAFGDLKTDCENKIAFFLGDYDKFPLEDFFVGVVD